MAKQLENQIAELQQKCDEANRNVNDLNSQKAKMQAENSNVVAQLEDTEHQIGSLSKERNSLQSIIDELRQNVEEETRVHSLILNYFLFRYHFVLLKQGLKQDIKSLALKFGNMFTSLRSHFVITKNFKVVLYSLV